LLKTSDVAILFATVAQIDQKLGVSLGFRVVRNPLYFFRFTNNLRRLKGSEITRTAGQGDMTARGHL